MLYIKLFVYMIYNEYILFLFQYTIKFFTLLIFDEEKEERKYRLKLSFFVFVHIKIVFNQLHDFVC